jgi:hypothetical protein
MVNRSRNPRHIPRKLMFRAVLFTIPTVFFWACKYFNISRITRVVNINNVLYYFVVIGLPVVAMVFLIRARLMIFKVEIDSNNFKSQSEDLRINAVLFFYVILLFFVKLFGFILK